MFLGLAVDLTSTLHELDDKFKEKIIILEDQLTR